MMVVARRVVVCILVGDRGVVAIQVVTSVEGVIPVVIPLVIQEVVVIPVVIQVVAQDMQEDMISVEEVLVALPVALPAALPVALLTIQPPLQGVVVMEGAAPPQFATAIAAEKTQPSKSACWIASMKK